MLTAVDAAQLAPQLEATAVFASLVGAWAMMRPTMVRDYDQRKLPPNTTARVMFVVLCIFVYVAITLIFYSFNTVATNVGSNLPVIGSVLPHFKATAPLYAAITLMGLLQLSMFRDLERSLLIWLHSAGHLHQDSQILAHHLSRCEFEPSPEDRRQDIDMAKKLGVHVTTSFDDLGVGVVTFTNWRKVASLLRAIRQWNPKEGGALSADDMRLLDEIETAHERKTQLAITIVKLVERAERGDPSARSLAELSQLLAAERNVDPAGVAVIEARLRQIVSDGASDPAQPLRLTGEEFHNYLTQIEGYFQVEYDILLQQISELAARSVVLAGEYASDRLEQLRGMGFGGLGYIEPINVNRSLWIFMLVSIGGFLVMFFGAYAGRSSGQAPPADLLARFAFVMALASLVGAFTASRRALAGSTQTPWGAYVLAGLAAVGLHLAVHVMFDIPKILATSDAAAVGDAAAATKAGSGIVPVQRRLLWGCLPFFLVLAICRLGRLNRWPIPDAMKSPGGYAERLLDGLAVSLTMLLSFYLVIALHLATGQLLAPRIKSMFDERGLSGLAFTSPALTLIAVGFLIGFFVVRDVRRAVHARIVDYSAAAQPRPAIEPPKALPAPA